MRALAYKRIALNILFLTSSYVLHAPGGKEHRLRSYLWQYFFGSFNQWTLEFLCCWHLQLHAMGWGYKCENLEINKGTSCLAFIYPLGSDCITWPADHWCLRHLLVDGTRGVQASEWHVRRGGTTLFRGEKDWGPIGNNTSFSHAKQTC